MHVDWMRLEDREWKGEEVGGQCMLTRCVSRIEGGRARRSEADAC
jgi:hypothetical protein